MQFFPFQYSADEQLLLAPYRRPVDHDAALELWVAGLSAPGEHLETCALLKRISSCLHDTFHDAVSSASRLLGLATRFENGSLHDPLSPEAGGSTHAWAEVHLPGAGWTGFDPTTGTLAGPDHIAVAISHRPGAVPPLAGSFRGPA
jgi:hypothetical protein